MILEGANRITQIFVDNEFIDAEDKNKFSFGLEIILVSLTTFGGVVMLGMMFGRFLETICFMVAFGWLRSKAGGFHMKTQTKCFLLMAIMAFSAIVVAERLVTENHLGILCLMLVIAGILVTLKVPGKKESGSSSSGLKNFIRKDALVIFLGLSFLIITSASLFDNLMNVSFVAACGLFAESITLL